MLFFLFIFSTLSVAAMQNDPRVEEAEETIPFIMSGKKYHDRNATPLVLIRQLRSTFKNSDELRRLEIFWYGLAAVESNFRCEEEMPGANEIAQSLSSLSENAQSVKTLEQLADLAQAHRTLDPNNDALTQVRNAINKRYWEAKKEEGQGAD